TATPLTADAYSFGCFAYEVLTGETLFDAPNEVAMISAHLTHDGVPPRMKHMAVSPVTAGLSKVLRRCLRRRPKDRGTVAEIREELRDVGAKLADVGWPLPA